MNQQAALHLQASQTTLQGNEDGKKPGQQGDTPSKPSPPHTHLMQPGESISTMQQHDIGANVNNQGIPMHMNGQSPHLINDKGYPKQGHPQSMNLDATNLNDSWNRPQSQSQLMVQNGVSGLANQLTRSGGEQTLNAVNGLGSSSEFNGHHYPAVSSMSSPLLSPKSTHVNGNQTSFHQPLTINNPQNSLLSPGIVSPNLLSPHQALMSPNTPKIGANANGFKVPKMSLLYDPREVPKAPPAPKPDLPIDKLSPPTPSITVSKRIVVRIF